MKYKVPFYGFIRSHFYLQGPLNILLIILIMLSFMAKYKLISLININWDEFRFLADIYKYNRNELSSALQTFQVHLFSWLIDIDVGEIKQIFIARKVMYLLQLGSCFFLFIISRIFLNKTASLFAVFSYISFSYVVIHGTSFRYDPICLFLLLLSLYLILKKDRDLYTVTSAFIFAMAMMVSIKSIFYIPILFLSMYINDWRKNYVFYSLYRIVLFFYSAFVAFVIFYLWHKSTLMPKYSWSLSQYTKSTSQGFILFSGTFPQQKYLATTLFKDFILWLFLLKGFVSTLRLTCNKGTEKEIKNNLILLTFFISLTPILFYRNIYPYFYAFMLAPVSIFIGVFYENVQKYFIQPTKYYLLVLFLIISSVAVSGFLTIKVQYYDQTISQSEHLNVVHKAFPQPVAYIDRSSVVPAFNKTGFFMSSIGIQSYLNKKKTIMERLLYEEKPVFIIANIPILNLTQNLYDFPVNSRLLEEDWLILKHNYIHHWGLIFVAGKEFHWKENSQEITFEILLPGLYTVETDVSKMLIDGQLQQNGDIIDLQTGQHVLKVGNNIGKIILRWGTHLYLPKTPPTPSPFFVGFK